jgi:hypothetical protein
MNSAHSSTAPPPPTSLINNYTSRAKVVKVCTLVSSNYQRFALRNWICCSFIFQVLKNDADLQNQHEKWHPLVPAVTAIYVIFQASCNNSAEGKSNQFQFLTWYYSHGLNEVKLKEFFNNVLPPGQKQIETLSTLKGKCKIGKDLQVRD